VGFKRLHYNTDTDINKLTLSNIVSENEAYQGNGFNRNKENNKEDFGTQITEAKFHFFFCFIRRLLRTRFMEETSL
jgi:hypothetical protein